MTEHTLTMVEHTLTVTDWENYFRTAYNFLGEGFRAKISRNEGLLNWNLPQGQKHLKTLEKKVGLKTAVKVHPHVCVK